MSPTSHVRESSPSLLLSPVIQFGGKTNFRRLASKETSVVQLPSAMTSPPGPIHSYSTKLPSRLILRQKKRERSPPKRKHSPSVKALYIDPVLGTPIANLIKQRKNRSSRS